MTKPSKAVLVNLMKTYNPNNPELWENEQLAMILFKKLRANRGVTVNKQESILKRIKDIGVGEYVEVEGIVTQHAGTGQYTGCSVCKKKVPGCTEHSEGIITVYMHKFKLTDQLDGIEMDFTIWNTNKEYANILVVGNKVKLCGKTNVWNNALSLAVGKEPEILSKIDGAAAIRQALLEDIMSQLARSVSFKKEVLEERLKADNLTWEDIQDKIVETDAPNGKVWRLK